MARAAWRLHGFAMLIASAHVLPAAAQQSRGGGSEAPCIAPLHWRVTRVDREFGLDIPQATDVVREAAALWQGAARQPLLVHDEAEGFPIRIVYDERQERNQERLRSQERIEAEQLRIEAGQSEIERRSAAHGDAWAKHREQVRELETRVAAHNAAVRSWNERGGAPPGPRTDLEAVGEALDRDREQLAASGRALDDEASAIQEAQERLARDVAAYNQRVDEHARAFPPVAVRSGEYREAVQRVGGRVAGISREIRIYRFANRDELRLIAAHELGHALGLGHAGDADAVMSEQHDSGVHPEGIDDLDPADAALLAATCPALASEGR